MNKWSFYTSKEIKPQGWLRRQLEIQAEGLSGNLHKIWPDVRDSAWIGGKSEGWERVPYWLDGFIPLAYLLEREDMIADAKRYIDAIISAQKPDGWICPCSDDKRKKYDTWAVLLISKVLTVYYECSGDERIPSVIRSILRNYYDLLSSGEIKLFSWGKFRWFEGFIAINFLWKREQEEWLRELALILRNQGADYESFTELWKKDWHKIPWWLKPRKRWTFDTHIVNIGMMLKSEAVSCSILGEKYTDKAERLHRVLEEYNSTPVGLFTGDECVSGLSPIQGTELCAVVEQMYSYEILFAETGDNKWAERLEKLAFNALPATISDDMWTHQYVQMSNQMACQKLPGRKLFRTNGPAAHTFGLEPEFGCCTANFNQGWPKFALSVFMHKDNTVINAVPVPCELNCEGKKIRIETDYPFKNSFKYSVEAEEAFTFEIRIPSFAKNLKVNGEAASLGGLSFEIAKGESREITVSFDTEVAFIKRPYGLNAVTKGSLVFSVPVKAEKLMHEYTERGVERKFPYCDYELKPASDWNYAYADTATETIEGAVGDIPFSSEKPPLVLKAQVSKIDWGFAKGLDTVCAKVPKSRKAISEREEILLYPYGCAKLRMTELPFAE